MFSPELRPTRKFYGRREVRSRAYAAGRSFHTHESSGLSDRALRLNFINIVHDLTVKVCGHKAESHSGYAVSAGASS